MSRLLELVGACVRADETPSGLNGAVAIGVRSRDAIEWLTVDLAVPGGVTFGEELPERADAMLILDDADADAILHRGKARGPASSRVFRGDLALFERFVARYLKPPSVFDLRRAPPAKNLGRRSKR